VTRFVRGTWVAALAFTLVVAGCGSTQLDSGGLSAGDRSAAQDALDTLHGSNIPVQLVAISEMVEETPAACRVHLVSKHPERLQGLRVLDPAHRGNDYTWLNMTLTGDRAGDRFQLGAAHPVLPGGQLSANGRNVVPGTVDTTLLSRYGPAQARKSHETMLAHAGDAFSKPGANCQVLSNGDLRLVPNQNTAKGEAG
jgi:hypothetical protein